MDTTHSSITQQQRVSRLSMRAILLYGGLGALILFTLLFRLGQYPDPWFDEGAFLNVARTLAFDGVYAESSMAGYRYTGPVASTGPTLILPVAVMFRLFGVSIQAARLVSVVYGIGTLILVYLVGRSMGDHRMGMIALLLAAFGADALMPAIYREATGEGVGLFFLLAGLYVWLRPGRRSYHALAIGGVLLGLSCVTKLQNAIFILPALLLALVTDRLWYHRGRWSDFLIPGICAGVVTFAWAYIVMFVLGGPTRDVSGDAEGLRSATLSAYLVIQPYTNMTNIRQIIGGQSLGPVIVPALAYGSMLALRRDEDGQRWGIIWLFAAGASCMFIFSIGWPRNMATLSFLIALLAARLAGDVTSSIRASLQAMWGRIRADQSLTLSDLMIVVLVSTSLAVIGLPVVQNVYRVIRQGNHTYAHLGAYLNEAVPQDAIIETWDKEVSILSEHVYHFPPDEVETLVNQGIQPIDTLYDFRDYVDADYVITGRVGGRLYTDAQLVDYELVATFGRYGVYRRAH